MKRQTIFLIIALVLPLLALAAGLHGLALAQGPGIVDAQAVVGTGFTYQGQLLHDGSPVTATCSMNFWLFDGSGDQAAAPLTLSVPVTNGLFTATLDFGGGAFDGEARSLEIRVNCGEGLVSLGRQPLTPAPLALALPGLWTQQNETSPNLIGGYSGNSVSASAVGSTIGGGGNSSNPNQVTANYGTVGGGEGNKAITGTYTTVAGGQGNQASGDYAAVGGGQRNKAIAGLYTTVAGGQDNEASGAYAAVGGGISGEAKGTAATVPGGFGNHANGEYAIVSGGSYNEAAGDHSFAAGQRAHAYQDGCFVWGDDSINADVNCNTANAFIVRASGGVTFYTHSDLSTGVTVPHGEGAWTTASDRALKANVVPVDGGDVLAQLMRVPVSTWNYTSQDPSIRHMGPMAQDFYAAFGLGVDERHISTVDADGVALAAIQALAAENAALKSQNVAQQRALDDLQKRLAALEAVVNGGEP